MQEQSVLLDRIDTLSRTLKDRDEQIESLTELVRQRDLKISRIEAQLSELLKRIYGRKSERLDPNQLLMGDILLTAEKSKPVIEESPAVVKEQRVREHLRKHRGRVPLPEHLERVEHELEIEAEEKICTCCGKELVRIGEDITERLEYRRSALFVNRYIRGKYACSHSECEGCAVKQAEAPAGPIPRCEAESGLLAHIIVEKFEDHNPLYRQQQRFQRQGLELNRSTMSEWLARCAYVLSPLYEKMKEKILSCDIVLNDDTPVAQQEPGLGKTRTARLWCTVGGEDLRYTLYNFTRGRSRDGPEEFFKDYKGYFVADAFSGYNGLFDRGHILHVGCWAHARRYFVKAQDSNPREATEVLVLIAQLYKVEAENKNSGAAGRLKARQKKSRKVLEKLKVLLQEQRARALPKSPLGEAIDYTLRLWKQLSLYIEDGRLPIDNNLAEQGIRPVALGRKNWLFVGSENGGRTAAVLLSFCTTCHKLKIDTWEYLRDVLQRINDCRMSRLDKLLPDNWKRLRAAS